MLHYTDITDKNLAHLPTGTTIKGEFHFSGPTYVQSNLEGNFFLHNNCYLQIGVEAYVQGPIKGGTVEILGRFQGEIDAEKIIIGPVAKVNADLKSKELVVFPGAILNSRSDIDAN